MCIVTICLSGACRKAPETKGFCADHYWYGDNKCGEKYCRVTDEKYLQWQCKKTCRLCNTDPSQKVGSQNIKIFGIKVKIFSDLSGNGPDV